MSHLENLRSAFLLAPPNYAMVYTEKDTVPVDFALLRNGECVGRPERAGSAARER
ncbi:hypothetical protein K438DRAFT_1974970 [Mycena galopus ATCC 62051]|nr:hypothetical protein K438DRAFT_1974970 [Mycena galopus ATCC 62051]